MVWFDHLIAIIPLAIKMNKNLDSMARNTSVSCVRCLNYLLNVTTIKHLIGDSCKCAVCSVHAGE